nr:MAG TPA: maltose binding periplasmic protein [Caudoviricetes sp.]
MSYFVEFRSFCDQIARSASSGTGSDVRRLIRRLKAGPSAPGYLILPLRNCRSTGSRN